MERRELRDMQPQGPQQPQQYPPQYQVPPQFQYGFPPPPPVKWYHQKWFVVLMVIVFFPVGLALLWTSPVTKMSGRIIWSIIIALSLVSYIGGRDSENSPSSAENSASNSTTSPTTPSTQQSSSKPPEPPKDEYPYKLTDQSTGKVYQGKIASNVGVAVIEVKPSKTVGTNEFLRKTASGGAVFVVVRVVVSNGQKDAITVDSNLFKILADGREYSASTEAMTALMADDKETFFLKQINPGLNSAGTIAFEVPESLKLDGAQLQFRGGMTGKTEVLPLRPVIQ